MSNYILPEIGSSGYYTLATPLDTLITATERYTCKGIRKLSEYLAGGEDPYTLIYQTYKLSKDLFKEDIAEDMSIVSLQGDTGHWLYIPAKYIATYPITNGIPYRAVMIGISLPSLPVSKSLTYLESDLSNLVIDSLGVTPVIKTVETSRVVQVDKAIHDKTTMERSKLSGGRVTDASRYAALKLDFDIALDKIHGLEEFILAHQPWESILIFKPTCTRIHEWNDLQTFESSLLATNLGKWTLHSSEWEVFSSTVIDYSTPPIMSHVSTTGNLYEWTTPEVLPAGDYKVRVRHIVTGLKSVWSDPPTTFTIAPAILNKPTITIPLVVMSTNLFKGSTPTTNKGIKTLTKAVWKIFNEGVTDYTTTPVDTATITTGLTWTNTTPLSPSTKYQIYVEYEVDGIVGSIRSDVITFSVSAPVIDKPTIFIDHGKIKGSNLNTNFGVYTTSDTVNKVYTTHSSEWRLIDPDTKLDILTSANNKVTNTDSSNVIPSIEDVPFSTDILTFDKPYSLYVKYSIEKADGTIVVSEESNPFSVTRSEIPTVLSNDTPNLVSMTIKSSMSAIYVPVEIVWTVTSQVGLAAPVVTTTNTGSNRTLTIAPLVDKAQYTVVSEWKLSASDSRKSKDYNFSVGLIGSPVHISDDIPTPPFSPDIYGVNLDAGVHGVLLDLAPVAFNVSLDCIYVGPGLGIGLIGPTGKKVSIPAMTVITSEQGLTSMYAQRLAQYPEYKVALYSDYNQDLFGMAKLVNGMQSWKVLQLVAP